MIRPNGEPDDGFLFMDDLAEPGAAVFVVGPLRVQTDALVGDGGNQCFIGGVGCCLRHPSAPRWMGIYPDLLVLVVLLSLAFQMLLRMNGSLRYTLFVRFGRDDRHFHIFFDRPLHYRIFFE